jgi:hypothetical protein
LFSRYYPYNAIIVTREQSSGPGLPPFGQNLAGCHGGYGEKPLFFNGKCPFYDEYILP